MYGIKVAINRNILKSPPPIAPNNSKSIKIKHLRRNIILSSLKAKRNANVIERKPSHLGISLFLRS